MCRAIFLFVIASQAFAGHRYAASLSPADIQAAVNAANPGDYVILPAGNFIGFNATVNVPNGISVVGQGKSSTIIRKTATSTIIMFRFNSSRQDSNFQVEIGGFTLYGRDDQVTEDTGIQVNTTKNFKVHDIEFHGFGYCGIETHGYTFGVIWECWFIDCYKQGSGYGVLALRDEPGEARPGDASWNQPVIWGGNEFVFVEDCYFLGARHSIASGYGARYVFRYNTSENEQGQAGSAHVDTHGKTQGAPFRGTRAVEIYNNIIRNQPGNVFDGMVIHGGDALIFNNSLGPNIAFAIVFMEAGCTNDPSAYPYSDQMRESYVWGNTEDGRPINQVGNGDGPDVVIYCPEWLQENRDFFLYPRPGYTPFPYPHPLRESILHLFLDFIHDVLNHCRSQHAVQPVFQNFRLWWKNSQLDDYR